MDCRRRNYFFNPKTLDLHIEFDKGMSQDFITEATDSGHVAVIQFEGKEIRCYDTDFLENVWSQRNDFQTEEIQKLRNRIFDLVNEYAANEVIVEKNRRSSNDRSNIIGPSTRSGTR